MLKSLSAVGMTALGLLIAAIPANAAPPNAGNRFDGQTTKNFPVFLDVPSAGKPVKEFFFSSRTKCSDGRKRGQSLVSVNEPDIRIDAEGNFNSSSKSGPLTFGLRNGKTTKGTAMMTYKGTFTTPDQVVGTLRSKFRSPKLTCDSGDVPFVLDRAGSAAQPFRTSKLATGRYSLRGRGIRAKRLRVYAPLPTVDPLNISVEQRCRTGAVARAGFVVTDGIVAARSADDVVYRSKLGRGLKSRDRVTVRLRFFKRGESFRVAGYIRVRRNISRGGRQVDTCDTGRRKVSGRFLSGPDALTP